MVLNLRNPIGAFCKGRKSETYIYPAFEVILRKTLEHLQRFYSILEHPGRTTMAKCIMKAWLEMETFQKMVQYRQDLLLT